MITMLFVRIKDGEVFYTMDDSVSADEGWNEINITEVNCNIFSMLHVIVDRELKESE